MYSRRGDCKNHLSLLFQWKCHWTGVNCCYSGKTVLSDPTASFQPFQLRLYNSKHSLVWWCVLCLICPPVHFRKSQIMLSNNHVVQHLLLAFDTRCAFNHKCLNFPSFWLRGEMGNFFKCQIQILNLCDFYTSTEVKSEILRVVTGLKKEAVDNIQIAMKKLFGQTNCQDNMT